jgi:hypothetical protein
MRKKTDDAVFMLGFVMLACGAGVVFSVIVKVLVWLLR